MEVGLFLRFGKLVPGREEKAIELFTEAVEYFGAKVKKGILTYFEPFFLRTADLEEETGFMIMRGPAPEVFKMIEEEPFLKLVEKGYFLVEHLTWHLLTVGEGITQQLERSGKVRAELGIV